MLAIRMTRQGRRHLAFYRVVVIDSRSRRDGRYKDLLGHYDPMKTPKEFKIDLEKYDEWVSKGAQPSDTVKQLVKKLRKAVV